MRDRTNNRDIAPPQCWKCDARKPTYVDESGLRQYTCVQCGATWNDRLPGIESGHENLPARGPFLPGIPTHGKRGGREEY